MSRGVEHNCRDWQDRLQHELDAVAGAPAEHPSACPACRELHAAAGLLRRGLCLLAPPPVPAGLAARVVGRVLADRRQRQRRRLRVTCALSLAASVAVIVLAGRPAPRPEAGPGAERLAAVRPVPSIRETVNEAGSAVAGLTARAVDRTRQMLPVVDEDLLPPMELQPPEPPGRSLLEAGQGITAGLEPIADSARRAFTLFRRELPPLDVENKPEL